MSYDVTALPNYAKKNMTDLIKKAVLGAKTVTFFPIQAGIKKTENVLAMDTDVVFQANACGRNANGSTVFTERSITVGAVKIEEDLCTIDLVDKSVAYVTKAGSYSDDVPFEQQYAELKSEMIAAANEKALWQGDTTSGDANLNKYDGFIKNIDAESGVINGNTSNETSITASNAKLIADNIYKAFPMALKGREKIIACGYDFLDDYIQNIQDLNLYNYSLDNDESGNVKLVGKMGTTLVAFHGLDGTNRLFGGQKENFVVGTDLAGEFEQYKMMYNEFEDITMFTCKFKLGTAVKVPSEIVEFTVSA